MEKVLPGKRPRGADGGNNDNGAAIGCRGVYFEFCAVWVRLMLWKNKLFLMKNTLKRGNIVVA